MQQKAGIPVYTLRAAAPSDTGWLLSLEEACMRPYAEALWGTWYPRAPADLDPARVEIIEIGGRPVGCLEAVREGTYLRIRKLYILPQWQRRGIGGRVLGEWLGRADAKGIATVLTVLVTNPAVAFYQRHGFAVESETPERRQMIRPAP